jgi:carboxypeptidase C (cathepsin A)
MRLVARGVQCMSNGYQGDHYVKSYTGFIDVEDDWEHLLFYFLESRHSPDEDPVTLRITVGAGGPSTISDACWISYGSPNTPK